MLLSATSSASQSILSQAASTAPACAVDKGTYCAIAWERTGVSWIAQPGLLIQPLIQIVGIVLLALFFRMASHRIIDQVTLNGKDESSKRRFAIRVPSSLRKIQERAPETFNLNSERRVQRSKTLGSLLKSISSAVIFAVGFLTVLQQLGIQLAPLLASAGVAGVAIGFGAQNLVRDVISGFFLILEDQVRVGDVARINGVGGMVEQINLRTIVVRDGEGAVQVFPNGTITTLANLSKQFAYAVVDLRLAYSENIDRVAGTIREVGATLQHDAAWEAFVLQPIEIVGIESLDNGFATLRVKIKTLPLHQGQVANELRRRLLTTFVGRGIRPYAG